MKKMFTNAIMAETASTLFVAFPQFFFGIVLDERPLGSLHEAAVAVFEGAV